MLIQPPLGNRNEHEEVSKTVNFAKDKFPGQEPTHATVYGSYLENGAYDHRPKEVLVLLKLRNDLMHTAYGIRCVVKSGSFGDLRDKERLPAPRRWAENHCYKSPQDIAQVPPISLEGQHLPISNNSVWPLHRSLAVHKSDQTHSDLDTITRHTGISLSRRLDSRSKIQTPVTPAHHQIDRNDGIIRLADKSREVNADPQSVAGTLGFHSQHQGDNSQSSGFEDQGYPEVDTIRAETTEGLPSVSSQPDHEDTFGGDGYFPNELVHTSADVVQESSCPEPTPLGSRTSSASGSTARTTLVAQIPSQVERSRAAKSGPDKTIFVDASNSGWGGVGMGKSVQGVAEKLHHTDPLRQYDRDGIHQQTRRHSVTIAQSAGNLHLGNVSQEGSPSASQTHSGSRQHRGGCGFSSLLHEEHVADSTHDLSDDNPTAVREERCRSICRSLVSPTTELCLVEDGSSSDGDGRSYHSVAELPTSVDPPSLESHSHLPQEAPYESSTGDDHSPILAERSLISTTTTDEQVSTIAVRSKRACSNHLSSLALAMDKSRLEDIRMGCLKRKFQGSHYSQDAADTLLAHFTAKTSSNRLYAKAHHLFIAWCLDQGVDICYFTAPQLMNFLVDGHRSGYSINSIEVFKSAILQLHLDRDSLDGDTDVRTLIKNFKKNGPPLSLTKPLVDLTLTLSFLAKVPSNARTSLKALNQKTAFLLAMAAFLRPSDLFCIVLSQCVIDAQARFTLCIEAPKETRQDGPIIKSLTVHSLATDDPLCPVAAFLALKNHPGASHRPKDNLLVNSINPAKPITVGAISSWIRRLIKMSTDLVPVPSVRSIASDLALSRGALKEDVVTLGNWSSESVFENHYRRSRLQSTNMSAVILRNSYR